MKRRLAVLLIPAVAIVLSAQPILAQEGRGEITAAQVRAAIEKGVAYLKSAQRADGSWDDYTGYSGGVSCLCTLALLNCGVSLDDPQMHKALEFVRSLKAEKTYVVSLQTMVMCLAEPKRDLLHIKTNVQWLEDLQNQPDLKEKDPRRGSWTYMPDFARGGGDPSNSQFAMLALYEAERVGVPVKDRTWRLALDYWVRQQNNDGSWSYFPQREMPGTGSMTCAGIASVFIASGRLSAGDAEVTPQGLKCCGQQLDDPAVAAIEKGLVWLGNNFSVHMNPGPGSLGTWHLYYLYAVERVGRMTSHRFFNSRDFKHYDWYRMGAEQLVQQQDEPERLLEGGWPCGNHAANQHQFRALVSGERTPAGAHRQSPLRTDRRLGSASRRFGAFNRLCGNQMETRISARAFVANCRSRRSLSRRSACNRRCCTSAAAKSCRWKIRPRSCGNISIVVASSSPRPAAQRVPVSTKVFAS